MDDHLRRSEQEFLGSPADERARRRLQAELARLANLDDRHLWKQADPGSQDLVLQVVERLLGPAYELQGAGSYAVADQVHRIGAYVHLPTELVLHLLPGGSFVMGSNEGPEREQPTRTVHVAPLLLGRLPTTQASWDRVGGEDSRNWHGPELPVEGVTYHAVQTWLGVTGGGLRLPSEAEWEYACRAGSQSRFFWGDTMDEEFCWFGEGAEWTTHPPSAHVDRPNAFGLVDMVGNVAEWCEDTYADGYEHAPSDGSPYRGRSSLRVVRGGDSFNRASHCRTAYRSMTRATDRGAGIGFRVARSFPL